MIFHVRIDSYNLLGVWVSYNDKLFVIFNRHYFMSKNVDVQYKDRFLHLILVFVWVIMETIFIEKKGNQYLVENLNLLIVERKEISPCRLE